MKKAEIRDYTGSLIAIVEFDMIENLGGGTVALILKDNIKFIFNSKSVYMHVIDVKKSKKVGKKQKEADTHRGFGK